MKISQIGLGTAAIGRPLYINIKSSETKPFDLNDFKKKGYQVLESAYEQGVRYFDTAPGYGLAEELIIEWVKDKKDDSIELATKWGYAYVANFDPKASVHEVKDHSLEQLMKQWKASKKLLPNLSSLQIHSATFETGVLEDNDVLDVLAALKSEFSLKIGLTTTGDNQVSVLKKALEIKVGNEQLFEVFQITYNILDQSLLMILDEIKSAGHRIVIKEALANGRVFPNEKYPQYEEMYSSLTRMSKQYSVGIDAIALRFCIQTTSPFIVLSGASEGYQIKENLKTNDFELSNEDILELKSFGVGALEYWSERKELGWN